MKINFIPVGELRTAYKENMKGILEKQDITPKKVSEFFQQAISVNLCSFAPCAGTFDVNGGGNGND
jgi:hypothetical protein